MYADFWQLPSGPCRSGSELPRIVSRSVLKALVVLDSSICHEPCSPKFQGPSKLYIYHEIRVLTDGCVISIQMNKPPLLVQSIMPWVASDFRPVYRAAVGQIQYVFWIHDAFKTVANSQACPYGAAKACILRGETHIMELPLGIIVHRMLGSDMLNALATTGLVAVD